LVRFVAVTVTVSEPPICTSKFVAVTVARSGVIDAMPCTVMTCALAVPAVPNVRRRHTDPS